MLAFTRFEIVRSLRNGRFLVFLVGMPVLLYLIISRGGGRAPDGLTTAAFVMVSMAVYSAMGAALFASGPQLSAERASGWIRQLRVTPLADRAWLAAKLVQASILTLPGSAAVAACALLTGHVQLDPPRWAALAAVVVMGVAPFTFLGLVIGQLLDGQAAQVAQTATLLPMSILGGVWVPFRTLPDAAQTVGRALPAYHLAELGRQVAAGAAVSPDHVLALAAWAAALGAAALLLWRREAVAATA